MFNFFRKRSKFEELSERCDEQKEHDEDSSMIGGGYAAAQTIQDMTEQAAQRFAKPDTYTGNRSQYDSGTAKAHAKKALFEGGKEVFDPYTGEKLVLTKKEAKLLYGEEWANHLAESDHVKPLERIYQDTKNSVWNTTDDIKKAANSDENIRVASRRFNNPKRSRTNKNYVEDEEYLKCKGVRLTEQGKKQAIRDGEAAEQSINRQLRKASFDNMIKTGREAGRASASNAGITALTMSGIMNLVSVIRGEKEADDAIADTIKDSGKAAVTGYVMGSGMTVASHSLSSSSSKFIQGLAKSRMPGTVITAVIVTGDTLKRWGDGEITTQQCMIELGEKGLNMATMGYSMAVGQTLIPIPVVGGAVGALVGSMLTSTYYQNLIHTLQVKELEHQERMWVIGECHAAAEQAKAFREELETYLDSYFKEYRDCFRTALSSIEFAYKTGDADGIIAGANQITRKLGGQVYYDSVEEFKSFLDDDSIDVL